MPEPVVAAAAPGAAVPDDLRVAARSVLARDGRDYLLQPWQVAYLVALTEGRHGVVPPGCGVGRGWLQVRLDEARASGAEG